MKFMTMTRTEISSLLPGARLARDVCDAKGLKLIPAETELTQALIDKLGSRGVRYVHVYDEAVSNDHARDESMARIRDVLDSRFRKVQENQVMQQLKEILLDFHEGRV